jgi:hypothetical protein
MCAGVCGHAHVHHAGVHVIMRVRTCNTPHGGHGAQLVLIIDFRKLCHFFGHLCGTQLLLPLRYGT